MLRVRPATSADADAMRALHTASVRQLASSHYDADQREAWAAPDADRDGFPFDDPDVYLAVAVRDDEIAGFGQLDIGEGEVVADYVHPDHARQGVGTALLVHLEGYARGRDLRNLHLTASMNAVEFYDRHGYDVTESATLDMSERVPGVELPVRVMEKSLR